MKLKEAVKAIQDLWEGDVLNVVEFRGEITIELEKRSLKPALSFLKEKAGFEVLMDLTAVDYLLPEKRTKVVYWLHHPNHYERIRVTIIVGRNEKVDTVVDLWEGADWYEREVYDLFGIRFEDHPDLKRILMPDDWVGHPLLRDHALVEESVEFKHGREPKIPSEIIPYVKNDEKP